MRYTIGQHVIVVFRDGNRLVGVAGTVANTLPPDVFEHSVLVVAKGPQHDQSGQPILEDGAQYVAWYAPEQLDEWQAQAA